MNDLRQVEKEMREEVDKGVGYGTCGRLREWADRIADALRGSEPGSVAADGLGSPLTRTECAWNAMLAAAPACAQEGDDMEHNFDNGSFRRGAILPAAAGQAGDESLPTDYLLIDGKMHKLDDIRWLLAANASAEEDDWTFTLINWGGKEYVPKHHANKRIAAEKARAEAAERECDRIRAALRDIGERIVTDPVKACDYFQRSAREALANGEREDGK